MIPSRPSKPGTGVLVPGVILLAIGVIGMSIFIPMTALEDDDFWPAIPSFGSAFLIGLTLTCIGAGVNGGARRRWNRKVREANQQVASDRLNHTFVTPLVFKNGGGLGITSVF